MKNQDRTILFALLIPLLSGCHYHRAVVNESPSQPCGFEKWSPCIAGPAYQLPAAVLEIAIEQPIRRIYEVKNSESGSSTQTLDEQYIDASGTTRSRRLEATTH